MSPYCLRLAGACGPSRVPSGVGLPFGRTSLPAGRAVPTEESDWRMEVFCGCTRKISAQALGIPSRIKYQNEGGPGTERLFRFGAGVPPSAPGS